MYVFMFIGLSFIRDAVIRVNLMWFEVWGGLRISSFFSRLLREFLILGSGNVICLFVYESLGGWCLQNEGFVWIFMVLMGAFVIDL